MNSAYSLLKVGSGSNAQAIHSALHAIPGVKTVHYLMGPTDVIVFWEAADQSALAQTIGKIAGVPGVASVDTRLVLAIG